MTAARISQVTTEPESPYPMPSLKDWGMVAIGIAFVAGGLMLLPHKRDVGIVTLAFFGPCLVVAVHNILRKFRFRRQRALKAEIIGGVPIRPSLAQILGIALTLTLMGVVLIVFGRSYGLIFWTIAWIIALIGGALLIGVLFGRIPNDYLQFDPDGITFGRARYKYMVPWDNIAQLSGGTMHENPALFIWLHDHERVSVQPSEAKTQLLKAFATGTSWAGAPIMLLPSRYNLDLPLLLCALERYLSDPAARSELAHRMLPRAARR